jgi:outer membrane receptor protein involved in Fe transport
LLAVCVGLLVLPCLRAEPVKLNIPAQSATDALMAFSKQAGVDVLYSSAELKKLTTPAVVGSFEPEAGLQLLLTRTGFQATNEGGKFLVRPVARAIPERPAAAPAGTLPPAVQQPAVQLQEFAVLGSRIRRTEVDGPSPVISYGIDEIRASGAMNLADFMRSVPQTYNGVGAGRNSAPDELNLMGGQRTENAIPQVPPPGASPFLDVNSPVQTGVSGVSLRGLGSGSTLVLVDGRRVAQAGNTNRSSASGQGFVDLNTIPLGLIERIEIITDGASAIYGADAVAGVINIVLKKSWVGTEVSSAIKLTEHGGARERQTTITTGFAGLGGRLNGTLAINYYDRDPLRASQRAFSANPDYRTVQLGVSATTGLPVFGSDQRIQWGYPASLQASVAAGFVSIPGVRVLLAPPGSATTPAISAFERRTINSPTQNPLLTSIVAQGQRITNPAPWTQLISGAERYGLAGHASYQWFPQVEIYGSYSFSDSRSVTKGLPAFTDTLVPVSAANNIFGENISFGMMLPEWGQVSQATKTQTHTITAGLRGQLGRNWRWDAGYRWQDQKYHSNNRNFDSTVFGAMANSADPTQRFNPFIDYRAPGAPSQAALLERAAVYPTVDGRSGLDSVDVSANGDVLRIWGGSIRAAVGGSWERDTNDFLSVAAFGYPVVRTPTSYYDVRTTRAAFGEVSVPLFGKPNAVPLLQRLEVNVAGRYEDLSDAGARRVPKYGAIWQPFRALLLRGSYSEGFRAPSLTEDRRNTTTATITLADPLRGNERYAFSFVGRSNPNLKPETSTNEAYGAVFEPPYAKGLSLSANFYRTEQKDAILTVGTNTVLNNPALFPDAVVRSPATAADTALGFPGRITTFYSQFLNFGMIRNESLDLGADYRVPWERLGRWRVSTNAAKTIKQTRALVVGGAPINDVGDTYASPRWNISSSLFWSKGPWTASSAFSYMSGYKSNLAGTVISTYGVPAMHLVDVRGAYEFRNGLWRGYGRGVRVGVGIANIEDKEPPFSNNIYGFNAGLHGRWVFGRTYELSFIVPIDGSKRAVR